MRHAIVLLLLSVAASLDAGPPRAFAIRDARVVTVSGPIIERGAVIIRDGLIQEVGPNPAIPADAWVIEGRGLTVYPGLIDSLSTLGIPEPAPGTRPAASPAPETPPARGPEDRPSTTSWINAADLISPADSRLETARAAGFTAAVTFPKRGIFAGQGAVISLAGETPGQMVIHTPAGLYLTLSYNSFGGGFPSSLMGVMAYIRQTFLDADHYRLWKELYARRPAGNKRPEYDRALEPLLTAPRLLLPASSAVELDRMLRFSAELKRPTVLYGAQEAYRAAALLKETGTPVLVSLKWPERSRDADPGDIESLRVLEFREKAPSTPSVLAREGVRFAFYSDGIQAPRDLLRAVKRAMDAGLPAAGAIRAFTLSAAEIYGVADQLGSIERGKIANLVVTRGDLFQENTIVKYVFVDGNKYEPLPETYGEVTQ